MRQCGSMLDQYVQRNYPREKFLKFSSLVGRRQLQSRTYRQASDTATPTPKSAEKVIEHTTPAPSYQDTDTQEVDWPDAIPVEIPSQSNQQNDQRVTIQSTQCNSELVKIPQLEENSDEEQYQDLDTYLSHQNTFEASQCIC